MSQVPHKRFKYENSNLMEDTFLHNLEFIIQSGIKYVKGFQDEVSAYEHLKYLKFAYKSKAVFCKTDCNKMDLILFLNQIGDFESIQFKTGSNLNNEYEIIFKNVQDADLCAVSSNTKFLFTKYNIYTPFSDLKDLCIRRNIPVCSLNQNMPIDYYKLIIGPLKESQELSKALDGISPLFGFKKSGSFYFLMFKDQSITKRVVEVLSKVKIKNNDEFCVKYAYENCIITRILDIPFVSSLDPTKIVFLLNRNIPKSFLDENIPNLFLEIKWTSHFTFIKCADLESSKLIYEKLGGMTFENIILISGYYPEFNYNIGDLE